MKSKQSTLILIATALTWLFATQTGWSFYNPSTGKWLNRDPLPEKGSDNLYRFVGNDPTDAMDADGRITVSHVISTFKTFDCGSYTVDFDFTLDSPAPCDGFFVQRVEYRHHSTRCNNPMINTAKVFYEAFPLVAKGTRGSVRDTFSLLNQPKSWGFEAAIGEVKFFCKSTTGDLYDPKSGWNKHGTRESVDLPSTTTPPSWWGSFAVEGPASHHVGSSWDCCCDNKWTVVRVVAVRELI